MILAFGCADKGTPLSTSTTETTVIKPHKPDPLPAPPEKPVNQYRLPLYRGDAPKISDVVQPQLAVCVVYAFLMAFVSQQPEAIKKNIKRVNDGFLVTAFTPQQENILIKDKWLDIVVGFTSPANRGIWPEVLASVLIYDLANERNPTNVDAGFSSIIKQIEKYATDNITFIEAIELLDKNLMTKRKNEYQANIDVFGQQGFIESHKIMMDFWYIFTGKPATTYRLPWDNPRGDQGKKVVDDFTSDEKSFDFISKKLAEQSIIVAYTNRHTKGVYDKGEWREGRDPYETTRSSGIYGHHNYAVIKTIKENGEFWLIIGNPHDRKNNKGPTYFLNRMFSSHNSSGLYKIMLKDFRRLFYTMSTN